MQFAQDSQMAAKFFAFVNGEGSLGLFFVSRSELKVFFLQISRISNLHCLILNSCFILGSLTAGQGRTNGSDTEKADLRRQVKELFNHKYGEYTACMYFIAPREYRKIPITDKHSQERMISILS